MSRISAETIDDFKAAGQGTLYTVSTLDARLGIQQMVDRPDFRQMATDAWGPTQAPANVTPEMADMFRHVNSRTEAVETGDVIRGFDLFLMTDQTFQDVVKARWALMDAQPPMEPNHADA